MIRSTTSLIRISKGKPLNLPSGEMAINPGTAAKLASPVFVLIDLPTLSFWALIGAGAGVGRGLTSPGLIPTLLD